MKKLAILLLMLYVCCRIGYSQSINDHKKLIGDWKLAIGLPEQDQQGNKQDAIFRGGGLKFFQDNTVDIRTPHFKYIGTGFDREQGTFLGTKTNYRMEKRLLRIFSFYDSTWHTAKITALNDSILTLRSPHGHALKYKKIHYNIDATPPFDEIILSASGCYGNCPALGISIKANGDVFYCGYAHNTLNGFYKGKISKHLYDSLQDNFRKADIGHIHTEQRACCDMQIITGTFIRNGEIFNNILDFGQGVTGEIRWAYKPLLYLYQRIPMQRLTENEVPFYLRLPFMSFTKDSAITFIHQNETFMLRELLITGKRCEADFNALYTLDIENEGMREWRLEKGETLPIREIKTDGRYYRFYLNNREVVIIDIGFDFIKQYINGRMPFIIPYEVRQKTFSGLRNISLSILILLVLITSVLANGVMYLYIFNFRRTKVRRAQMKVSRVISFLNGM